jgi:hypothetical protein
VQAGWSARAPYAQNLDQTCRYASRVNVSIASYNPASPGGSQPARASYGGHVSIRRHANSHLWGSPSTAAAVRKPLRRRTLKTWPLTSTNVPGYQRRLAIPDVAVVHVVRRAVHTRPTMIRAGSNRSAYSRYLQKSRFCDIGLLAQQSRQRQYVGIGSDMGAMAVTAELATSCEVSNPTRLIRCACQHSRSWTRNIRRGSRVF